MIQNGTYIMVDFKFKHGNDVPISLRDRHATAIYNSDVDFAVDFHGKNCIPEVNKLKLIAASLIGEFACFLYNAIFDRTDNFE